MTTIPLNISSSEQIPGSHPIVVIGPNGSGKTRFGVQLLELNDCEMVGAVRNIQMQQNIPVQGPIQANQNLTNSINRRRSAYWEMANEIDQLFSKLLAENSDAAVRFRDARMESEGPLVPKQTVLMRVTKLWERLFPGRTINFYGYSPKVAWLFGPETTEYTADRMSDGERVAIYLAGRVLNAKAGVFVVDEPEVHFHSLLAVQFWNALEETRPDLRFVYVTHDVTFALSRHNAQFIVVRREQQPELLPLDQDLPASVAEAILGAASFSMYARRFVFCEGDDRKSLDLQFYRAWFKDVDTAVVPVGPSSDVIRCTVAFGKDKLVQGGEALGVIDRDYWPDTYLNALPNAVWVLGVHELENLYCLETVYRALGEHFGIERSQLDGRYAEFCRRGRGQFSGTLLNKQISERFKQRCSGAFERHMHQAQILEDVTRMAASHADAARASGWQDPPEDIFEEERLLVQSALEGSDADFHRVLPGKVILSMAATTLGITPERYHGIICAALSGKHENLQPTGQKIEAALAKHLPPRSVEAAT